MGLSPSFLFRKGRQGSSLTLYAYTLWLGERAASVFPFALCKIEPDKTYLGFYILLFFHRELQVNLVRSHSAGNKKSLGVFPFSGTVGSGLITKRVTVSGVGKPLSPERSRMLLALRINVLAKGYSGISLETLQQVIEAFNGKKIFKENPPFPLFFFLLLTVSLKGVAQWIKLWMLVF